jgi:hypothetical protein
MELYNQLLCTFSTVENYAKNVQSIEQSYKVLNKCVFVLQNLNDPVDIFLTYNVEKSDVRLKNTILVHRKNGSNTIYSINALNQLILNSGEIQIDWVKYRNSIIINNDGELKIIPTKLLEIIRLK